MSSSSSSRVVVAVRVQQLHQQQQHPLLPGQAVVHREQTAPPMAQETVPLTPMTMTPEQLARLAG